MIRRTLAILRKAVLIGLTVAAVGTGALGVVSIRHRTVASGYLHDLLWVYVEVEGAHVHITILKGNLDVELPSLFSTHRYYGLENRAFRTVVDFLQEDPRRLGVCDGPSLTGFDLRVWRGLYANAVNRLIEVTLQLWFPFLLFAAYPAIVFIRGPWRRWRLIPPGCCRACRYDLTGNESGVCPECGTTVERKDR